MALPPPAAPLDLHDVLTNILRLTDNQADTLIAEGFDAPDELRFWSPDEIATWCSNKTKLPANRGGCPFGDPRVRNIQAYAFWVTDMYRRGLPRQLGAFDADTLLQYKELVRIFKSKSKTKEGHDVPLPKPLDAKTDWEDWELELINALSSRKGVDTIPLSYVIRPVARVALPITATTEETRQYDLIHNAPLVGPAFNSDNASVFAVLESLTLGQDSATWISRRTRQTKNGRRAMEELKSHYDSGEEHYKRKQKALSHLETLHYKHEKMMSFQVFSTKLKKCFDTIALCDQPYSDATQVDMLLRRMKTNDVEMRSVITLIRTDPTRYDTFTSAAQEISKHIAILYPESISKPGINRHNRKRNASAAEKSEKGHKIVNKDGKKTCNGVDVTDMTRSFSTKEWNKLPKSFKTELYNNPDRKKKKKLRNDRNASSTETSNAQATDAASTASATGSLNDETIGRIISGLMRGQLAQTQTGGSVAQPRMGAGGSAGGNGRNASSASIISQISEGTRWDHNGHLIP